MSRSLSKRKSILSAEDAHLLSEAHKIVEALGKMFAPCCEVVLHDLTNPKHAIMAIETPLSGRTVGQPTTELGLARIHDLNFPDVVQNYANVFPDGRSAKSTSIGLRNKDGKYIAAICLNLDVSLFASMQMVLETLTTTQGAQGSVKETLHGKSTRDIRRAITQYAAQYNTQPRALSPAQRRDLIAMLTKNGLMQLRSSASIAADILGVSRASIYNDMKG